MTDREWDRRLRIKTIGREDESDPNCAPYEPTPYAVLERVAESGYIRRRDRLLDYGCGKGRVAFFMAHAVGCAAVGIDHARRLIDLARDDMALAVAEAFRYDKLVLAAPPYDGNFFPKMEDFLLHLKAKAFQKRKAALVENGSWAPMAVKGMRAYLEQMKDLTICEQTVTIKSTVSEANKAQLTDLAKELLA